MKRTIVATVAGIALLFRPLIGQIIFEQPLSPRNANYRMEILLDTEKKQIRGNEILTWRNISTVAARELQFHLYMNAFKNNQSTHISESGGSGGKLRTKKAWGWTDIDAVRIVDGPDLTPALSFIRPDDDNEQDQTVVSIRLPRAVPPGGEISVSIDFTTQLPIVFRRNGYAADNFFFAAQWFPKIGVLENDGWNCHQFHSSTEFFADYGVYDVTLTLPREMVVGSTGVPLETIEHDSLKTLHIRAEDVHDFAWTAWPGYLVAETEHNGVTIIHLYEKDHASTVERTLNAMKMTMDYMENWVGEYPYPRVTVVHPPTQAMEVGGMEYPMFITGGSFWHMPEGIKAPEMVTVHEFGHNWFYHMIGNNEFEEAWLDEGINSYAEMRMMTEFYGEHTSMFDIPGFQMGEIAMQRQNYIKVPRWDRTLRPAWTYIGGNYATFSYGKPALMLVTLENYLTRPVMDRVMRTFFQRWKFRHPSSEDFIAVVNEVTGEDYNWFFDQLLKGSGDLDYRVASVWTGKGVTPAGLFDSDSGKVLLPVKTSEPDSSGAGTEASEEAAEMFKSTVRINRAGEVIIPVDVLLVFENGDSLTYTWDGAERWQRYRVEYPSKLAWASVDPERKLVLDKNFSNNSMAVTQRKAPVNYITARFIMFFETALQILGFMG
ncbi:M1 family metallopeptidase [bacterium]|nr:M1 family metallopeptidase [bacterium]